MTNRHMNPAIVLGSIEHHELMVLAMVGTGHTADASDHLNYELDRARVVPDDMLPSDVARMGSIVTYRSRDGGVHSAMLVYPSQVDEAGDRVSVLTPVGTALLGLRPGQTISWMDGNFVVQGLTVVSVDNPPAAVTDNLAHSGREMPVPSQP